MPQVSTNRFCELRLDNAKKGLCTSRPALYLSESVSYNYDGTLVCSPDEASEILNYMPEKDAGVFKNYISRDGLTLMSTTGGGITSAMTTLGAVRVGSVNRLVGACGDSKLYYYNPSLPGWVLIDETNFPNSLIQIGLLYGQTTGEATLIVLDGRCPHIYRPNATGGERTFRICWDKSGYMVDEITAMTAIGTVSLYAGSVVRAGCYKTLPAWCTHSSPAVDGIPILKAHAMLSKTGSPASQVYMKVFDYVTGTLRATSDPVQASSLTTSSVLTEFTFPSPYYNMLPSTGYRFVVEYASGDVANYVKVDYSPLGTGKITYTVAGGWDDTDVAAHTVNIDIQPGLAPEATNGLVHASRLMLLQPNDQKGYIWYSNLLDPDDWTAPATGTNVLPDAGAIPIGDASGEVINAIPIQTSLYLVNGGTVDGLYRLDGTGPSDFKLTKVMEGIRGYNFRAACSAGADGYVLDPKGLISVYEADSSRKLNESIVSHSVSDQLSLPAIPLLAWLPNYSQVWVINTTGDNTFPVYDTETKQWVTFKFTDFKPVSIIQTADGIYIAGDDKKLYKVSSAVDVDAGTAIELNYTSAFSDLANPWERKIFNRMDLEITAGFGASGTIYLYRDGIYDSDYYRSFGAVRSGKLTVGDLYGVPLASLKWPLGGSSSDTTFIYDHNYIGLTSFGGLDMTQFNFSATGPSTIGSDFKLRYDARRVMAKVVITDYSGKVRIKRLTLRGKLVGRRIQ